MTPKSPRIFPVLLSGGAGMRLWPLSRKNAPKQLVRLIGKQTLLQQAALRALDAELFEPLTVIAGHDHRFLVAEQLREIGVADATIVTEPVPRNTAPAAAIAALLAARSRPDALILLMPADHLIADAEGFRATVRTAADTARGGYLTLFGIRPNGPATGYGYIQVGAPLAGGDARCVASFVEKPDLRTAEAYVASGDYLWNSGIFLMPAKLLIEELGTHEPQLLEAAGEALEQAMQDADFLRLADVPFRRCRSVSLDYAVMERTERAVVIPSELEWTDVGSWSALWSLAARDEAETAAIGDVVTLDTRGSYVRSEGPLVATLGVENLIVVATKDAVLIAAKDHDQAIRDIVERLRISDPDRT